MMKLLADDRLRRYEFTSLVPANYTSTEVAKLLEQIESLAKKYDVTIVSKEEWGEKELAYSIRFKGKPVNTAVYYHWILQAPAAKLPEFDRALRLVSDIVRMLLIVSETDAEPVETPKKVAAKRSTKA